MLKRLHWICAAAALALAGMHAGCADMMNSMAKDVTPTVVAGVAKELADPKLQQQLVESIDEARIKTMSARLSAGFVDGVLATLEDPARRARLEALVNGLAASASGAAVDTIIGRALDDKVQERMRLVMRATVADLMTVIFDTANSRIGSTEDRTKAIGAAVHEIAKQATLGFQDALDDTRRDRESGAIAKESGALDIVVGNVSIAGDRILWTLGIGFAVIALGLAITLIWAIRKNRMRRSELEQRDGALQLLTEAIKESATKPGADEFRTVLKTVIRERPGGEHIRKVLGADGRQLLGIDKPE